MDLLEIMMKRRSIRSYTEEKIPEEKLTMILKAGLSAPSGRNRKPWEFILVEEKDTLMKLSQCRAHGSSMLKNAKAAIIVMADPEKTDVWTEDCSIAMSFMHLMADSLGVGSCWIQGRLREAADGRTTEEYIRELLFIPGGYQLEAILSLGIPDERPAAHSENELLWNKIHREKFRREV